MIFLVGLLVPLVWLLYLILVLVLSPAELVILLIPYLVLVLIFGMALVTTIVGNARGRMVSAIVWALLLGPLGWLIVLLMSDLRPRCPRCLSILNGGAIGCRYCRYEVTLKPDLRTSRTRKGADLDNPYGS